MPGKFIVVEGLEGAGKSSAISIIKSKIEARGHHVVCTREPGGTPMAEAIRACVKQDWRDEHVTVEAELMLMYAARSQLLENIIKPNLAQGTWVVGDRHDLSSRAYQGGGREIPETMLEPLRALTLKGFKPDFTLYMDVEPETGLARARGRGELDRIEMENISFFHRTRAMYQHIASKDDSIDTIDTMQDMASVHRDVEASINHFLDACS